MTKEEFFAQLNEIDPADVKAMEKAADRQAKLAKAGDAVCCFYYIAGTFRLQHHQPDTDADQPVSRAVITLL